MELGWVDFSREERNKILKTLSLLEDHTAVDELGIGIIRDEFANTLFPGTSTLHTRAKYLVLTPYLFAMAEKQSFKALREVPEWISKKEYELVGILIANSNTDFETGIIGLRNYRQKKAVKAKPSAIYWSALRTFEILKDERFSYKNACDVVFAKSKQKQIIRAQATDDTYDDPTSANQNLVIFSPITPDYSVDKEASIELTPTEAAFLHEKITIAKRTKDTLFAYLLKRKFFPSTFEEIGDMDLPDNLRRDYSLARDFSDFVIGAHIRYNVIYSDYQDEMMIKSYEEWRESFPFENFDLGKILARTNANHYTITFLSDLLEFTRTGDDESVDKTIIAREKQIKGDRAKLKNPTVYQYNSENPIHNYKLDYRYYVAKRIAADIFAKLGGEA